MALQWTPLRLSMVSGNGDLRSGVRTNYRPYRKMADIGTQCDPQDSELCEEPVYVNSTVAEINTSGDAADLDTTGTQPAFHRPLSVGSSSSWSSGEERDRRKPASSEELDVDAICVQHSSAEEDSTTELHKKSPEKTEPDGFVMQEKEDSNCGLDCVYFTMQCCECTIL